MSPFGSRHASKVDENKAFKEWNSEATSFHTLYEDLSLEDVLDATQEAQISLNLQSGEKGLENLLLPLVGWKALA